ncbi:MAG: RNA-binding S4 domain-containing protein [Tannerellaceae bacterium]
MAEVRIDKWLWATRIFKSRSIAVEACKKGRIMIGGTTVKASRMIKIGDVIQVKKPPIVYSFQVLDITERRMGAKLVPNFLKDVTPKEQLEILELSKITGFVDRAKGTGRPTKKDRRDLTDFTEPIYIDDDFDFEFDFDGKDD